MSKNVLIITTSLRKNSNYEILANSLAKGASLKNNVETINLKDYKIEFCKGCLACQNINICVIDDGMKNLIEKVRNADVLVFATPIYYYSISGLMKTFLDRLNPIYSMDYRFRDVYLISSCTDRDKDAIAGSVTTLKGWIDCFPKANLAGILCGSDCTIPNDINRHKNILESAKFLGEGI